MAFKTVSLSMGLEEWLWVTLAERKGGIFFKQLFG